MRSGAALLLLVLALAGCTSSPPPASPPPASGGDATTAQACEGAEPQRVASNPLVGMATTMGGICLELFVDPAPVTAGNFLNLTRAGTYDGTRFHRVIGPAKQPPQGFMIQDGDPLSKDPANKDRWGTGGTDDIPDEFPRDAQGNLVLKHDKPGLLSMANRGPNTGSSQYFITLAPTPWLDGKHAIFGQVVKGMEVVRAIGNVSTDSRDRPVEDVVIRDVNVEGS